MKKWILGIGLVLISTAAQADSVDVCFSPDQNCDARLISYLDESKTSLDVAIYDLTLPGVAEALERAQARGVRVRLIADHNSAAAKNSRIPRLKQAGIIVKLWSGENGQTGLMHNKFAIIDGLRLETGSYNYTYYATRRNAENQIYLTDAATISRFQAEFDRLWAQR
jgi:phosphatidylserine/phosphatidylglycerophosphate/cardiolipin synthase-like enzyme